MLRAKRMSKSKLPATARPEPQASHANPGLPERATWLILAALLLFLALVRWHRLGIPMERDEGEYAYAGQLILQGTAPYVDAYNMKLPGIYVFYAAIMAVFGQTLEGVHTGLLLVNLASTGLVFLIGRRLLDNLAGLGAAAVFGVLSLDSSVTGLFANSEHFVILPMLGGCLLLLAALRRGGWMWFAAAGICMGAAFATKQHAIVFAAFGAFAVAASEFGAESRDLRRMAQRLALFGLGAVVPFAALCSWMLWVGAFDRFWFWTFTYAAQYVSQVSFAQGMEQLGLQLAAMGGTLTGLWLLSAAGFAAAVLDRGLRAKWIWLIAFPVLSFAATCPGLLFRNHYFLFVLPAAGLLAGLALSTLAQRLSRAKKTNTAALLSGLLGAALLGIAVAGQWKILVSLPDAGVTRATFGLNPFPGLSNVFSVIRSSRRFSRYPV